jgi:hypothetical protein
MGLADHFIQIDAAIEPHLYLARTAEKREYSRQFASHL